ncbi:MAG: hypothetical protein QMC33_08570 [Octadecabacter sp.]|jgi:hypothetical protein
MTIIDQNTRPAARTSHASTLVHKAVQTAMTVTAVWRELLTPRPINPEHELAKAARRESARRATDTLMR